MTTYTFKLMNSSNSTTTADFPSDAAAIHHGTKISNGGKDGNMDIRIGFKPCVWIGGGLVLRPC